LLLLLLLLLLAAEVEKGWTVNHRYLLWGGQEEATLLMLASPFYFQLNYHL
jgi:hypothetical protein